MMKLHLEEELKAYEHEIEASLKPAVRLFPLVRETTLMESKLGGNPYYPKDLPYPVDKQGNPMRLLAQLNFEEMPPLEPFPTKGILQIFLPAKDIYFGAKTEESEADYKVVYHPTVLTESERLSDFSFVDMSAEMEEFPIQHEAGMTMDNTLQPISLGNYDFHEAVGVGEDWFKDDFKEETAMAYEEMERERACQCHIGGYPTFYLEDERSFDEDLRDYSINLLTLDSEMDHETNCNYYLVYYGEGSLGNFLMKEEDLKNLNFDDVRYVAIP